MSDKVALRALLSRRQWIAVAAVFVSLFLWFAWIFFSPNATPGGSTVSFVVEKGEPAAQIIARLHNAGVVKSTFTMRIAVLLTASGGRFKPGRYRIPDGLSYLSILDIFTNGKGDQLREVQVYDGITLRGLDTKLRENRILSGDSLFRLTENPGFITSLGHAQKSLRGYLMPGKYDFFERSTAEEVIAAMYRRHKGFFNDTLELRARVLGYSIHQVLTLASIIDGETNNPDEMPLISSVYHNRLHIGMKLQADPTVQFVRQQGWGRLRGNDLFIDSPYNTYRYYGLPPGPINNPGTHAILAALYPRESRYLYFVVDPRSGVHRFSESFAQHKKYAAEYHRYLNKKINANE